jgi:hypothetical protein
VGCVWEGWLASGIERGVWVWKWLDVILSTWQSRDERPVIPGRNKVQSTESIERSLPYIWKYIRFQEASLWHEDATPHWLAWLEYTDDTWIVAKGVSGASRRSLLLSSLSVWTSRLFGCYVKEKPAFNNKIMIYFFFKTSAVL